MVRNVHTAIIIPVKYIVFVMIDTFFSCAKLIQNEQKNKDFLVFSCQTSIKLGVKIVISP